MLSHITLCCALFSGLSQRYFRLEKHVFESTPNVPADPQLAPPVTAETFSTQGIDAPGRPQSMHELSKILLRTWKPVKKHAPSAQLRALPKVLALPVVEGHAVVPRRPSGAWSVSC